MYPQGYPDAKLLQLQLGSDKNVRRVKFAVMQGVDITIQEVCPLLHMHAHERGIRLWPTRVILRT